MRVNYLPYQAYNDMFIVLREGVWVTDVSVSDDFMAYAIIVKRDFLRSAMGNNVLPVRELFNRRLLFPAMPVEPVDFERIIDYIRQLRRNLTLHTHMYQSSLIQNALCNINLELFRVGYNNLIVTQTTHRVKKCFGKNSEFLPDFLEKLRRKP